MAHRKHSYSIMAHYTTPNCCVILYSNFRILFFLFVKHHKLFVMCLLFYDDTWKYICANTGMFFFMKHMNVLFLASLK